LFKRNTRMMVRMSIMAVSWSSKPLLSLLRPLRERMDRRTRILCIPQEIAENDLREESLNDFIHSGFFVLCVNGGICFFENPNSVHQRNQGVVVRRRRRDKNHLGFCRKLLFDLNQ